jgi:hypothetical protein
LKRKRREQRKMVLSYFQRMLIELRVMLMPVVPATQEVEVGGSLFKVSLGKRERLYLKKIKLKL